MLDEPLFSLELGEPYRPLTPSKADDEDIDDENCFVVNDTGIDLSQPKLVERLTIRFDFLINLDL